MDENPYKEVLEQAYLDYLNPTQSATLILDKIMKSFKTLKESEERT